MKKFLGAVLFLVISCCAVAQAKDYHVAARVKEAQAAVEKMIRSKSAAGLAQSVKEGVGVAIFPSVVKAGLIVGGRYGEGLMLRHDPKTGQWYGPAFFSISGGSVGLQIGASSTALVLTVNNEKGMKAFRGGTFTLGADVAAVAGPSGRNSYVGTNINADAPIFSYSITKGVFAGVALDGSVISELPRVNDACWGKHLNNVQIFHRKPARKDVQALIRKLNQLISLAK